MKNKFYFFVINFALLFAFGASFAVSTDTKEISTAEAIEGVPSGDRFTNCEPLFKAGSLCRSSIVRCYDNVFDSYVIIKSMPDATKNDIANEIAIFEHIREFNLINAIDLLAIMFEGKICSF